MDDQIKPKVSKDLQAWEEFRQSGLLWLVNSILHIFGWSLVVCKDLDKDGNVLDPVVDAYPVKTTWHGFDQETNDRNYLKITKFMAENCARLNKEAIENSKDKDLVQ